MSFLESKWWPNDLEGQGQWSHFQNRLRESQDAYLVQILLSQSVPYRLKYCVTASPIIQNIARFFHSFICWFLYRNNLPPYRLHRTSCPRNNLIHTKKKIFFSGKVQIPKRAPICSEWYGQWDRRKILEPPWSVLDTEALGPKTLDIAPNCGIIAQIHYKLSRGEAKMTLKVKVNGPHFQCQLRVSQDAYLVQIWWFQPKSVMSYLAN